MHYNRFRYYDPLSGQYTQQDPIGLEGGTPLLSQYVDDPVGWVDPLGLHGLCKASDPYSGVKKASKTLQENNVPRAYRKQILDSFQIDTIKTRKAGPSEYGTRYFDSSNASPSGRYLRATSL